MEPHLQEALEAKLDDQKSKYLLMKKEIKKTNRLCYINAWIMKKETKAA